MDEGRASTLLLLSSAMSLQQCSTASGIPDLQGLIAEIGSLDIGSVTKRYSVTTSTG